MSVKQTKIRPISKGVLPPVFNVGFPMRPALTCGRRFFTKYVIQHHRATLILNKNVCLATNNDFLQERPARIMDFRIDNYDSENQKATFSWTSPQDSYGKNSKSISIFYNTSIQ